MDGKGVSSTMLRAAATPAVAVVVVGLAVGAVAGLPWVQDCTVEVVVVTGAAVVTGAMGFVTVQSMVDQQVGGRTCRYIIMTFVSLATLTPSGYLVFPILSSPGSDIFILDSKRTQTALKMASD